MRFVRWKAICNARVSARYFYSVKSDFDDADAGWSKFTAENCS